MKCIFYSLASDSFPPKFLSNLILILYYYLKIPHTSKYMLGLAQQRRNFLKQHVCEYGYTQYSVQAPTILELIK